MDFPAPYVSSLVQENAALKRQNESLQLIVHLAETRAQSREQKIEADQVLLNDQARMLLAGILSEFDFLVLYPYC